MPNYLALVFAYTRSINLKLFFCTNFMARQRKSRIFLDIVKALKTCHDHQIAHQDIKLENVVVDPGQTVSLIDFGYSVHVLNVRKYFPRKFCGTPLYMAPEIIAKKNHDRKPQFSECSAALFAKLSS